MVAMVATIETMSSIEADIDRRLHELIANMVAGTATPQEDVEFQELSARRAKLMSPSPLRFRGPRAMRRRVG